jgi:hypothetical protein
MTTPRDSTRRIRTAASRRGISSGTGAFDGIRIDTVIASARRLDATSGRVASVADSPSRFTLSYLPRALQAYQDSRASTTGAMLRRALAVGVHPIRSSFVKGYLDDLRGALAALLDFSTRMNEYGLPSRPRPTGWSLRDDSSAGTGITLEQRGDRGLAHAHRYEEPNASTTRRARLTLISRLSRVLHIEPLLVYSGRANQETGAAHRWLYRTTVPAESAGESDHGSRHSTSPHRNILESAFGMRANRGAPGAVPPERTGSTIGASFTVREPGRVADRRSHLNGPVQLGRRAVEQRVFSADRHMASRLAGFSPRVHRSNTSTGLAGSGQSILRVDRAATRAARLRAIRPAAASPMMPMQATDDGIAARSQARAGGMSPPMVVNFSPTVALHGGTDEGEFERRVVQAIGHHSHELVRIVTRELRQRLRTAF